MNRTIRAIIAAALVLIIAFAAITICQNIGKSLRLDITDQKLYTLSNGTKSIIAKLNQPITLKLYYAKKAVLKAPDQIKFYNDYNQFVKDLLEEYVALSNGMIKLEIIDPTPFSDEEARAMQYGITRFPITQQENFFFGLVVQTQFGVEKVIPFFPPNRQNFIEYDISYLIDTAVTRKKTKVGILSSMPVVGDNVDGYMAQMMKMQGQTPKPAWIFVEQLKQKYEVTAVPTDTDQIAGIDILLVVHPRNLEQKTLFAIDQYVLKGGRTIVFLDPYFFLDTTNRNQMGMPQPGSENSELPGLLTAWGLEMPKLTFVGDRTLAIKTALMQNKRPETIIGFLGLTNENNCFSHDTVIAANLNQVRILFAGTLQKLETGENFDYTPIITTTDRGNAFTVENTFELLMPGESRLLQKFIDGTEPVVMAYQVKGKFKSAFPNGIQVEVEKETTPPEKEPEEPETTIEQRTGLTQADEDCVVTVFSDVDFISDRIAYQSTFFGKTVVGDNAALMMNTIDHMTGSTDLVKIRSRGNFSRPFIVVDKIEKQAEEDTLEKEKEINADIQKFTKELQQMLVSGGQNQQNIIDSSIPKKRKALQLKIRKAERDKQKVQKTKYESIDILGKILQNLNMITIPAAILIVAFVLGIRRSIRKRHYISHASDA